MKKIAGVRFRHTGKSYYYDPGELELSIGTGVIVQSGEGKEYGKVSIPPMEVDEEKLPAIIKQIVRLATPEDEEIVSENRAKEEEAFWVCKEKIAELSLPMKLIHAEYTFERSKLLFYFTAEGRVDFRELVRSLASIFRTRIELRQVGVRDEARLLGGMGICGRELCCNTYLSGFAPVSIKMAKEQNLSLNPTKISGLCGRLMCCLAHEEEAYEYLNRTMPKGGDFATNVEGQTGVIRSVNILKQSVLVIFEDGDTREMKEYLVSEIAVTPRREGEPSPEAVAEMKKNLEDALRKKMEEEIAQALEDGDEGEYNLLEKRAEELGLSDVVAKKPEKDQQGRPDRRRSRRPKKGDEEENRKNRPPRNRGGDFSSKKSGRGRPPRQEGQQERRSQEKNSRGKDFSGKPYSKKPQGGKRPQKSAHQSEHRNGGYSRGYRTDRKNS